MAKVSEAVAQGAQALLGGTVEGRMIAPTVLGDTTRSMRVNREEFSRRC